MRAQSPSCAVITPPKFDAKRKKRIRSYTTDVSLPETIVAIQQMLVGNGAAAGDPAPPLPSYPSMGGALRRQRWAVGREQRA